MPKFLMGGGCYYRQFRLPKKQLRKERSVGQFEGVSIRVNGNLREFSSRVDLMAYLAFEEKTWEWLQNLPALHRDAGTEIYEVLFHQPIEALRELLNGATKSDLAKPDNLFIESASAEGVLIKKTQKEYGEITAALALLYLNKETRLAISAAPKIKKFADSPNLAFDRSVAIQIALSLQEFMPTALDARSIALRTQLDRFAEHTVLAKNAVNSYAAEFTEEVSASKTKLENLGHTIGKSYVRRRKVYSAFAAKARLEAKRSVQDAIEALDSAKAAYHDQVDLNASVQYWSARRRSHSFFKSLWFLAVVASMSLTFVSMLAYYGYGGAAGLSHLIREQHPVEISLPQTAPGAASPPKMILGQNASDLSLAAADLAGAALLITLLGVIIKITLRQFNTHSHLSLEAAERITFTKTYLALLNEGKLKSDEDRRLILESLFRSTQSGAVAEIPFSSPIELILKTLSEKRPA